MCCKWVHASCKTRGAFILLACDMADNSSNEQDDSEERVFAAERIEKRRIRKVSSYYYLQPYYYHGPPLFFSGCMRPFCQNMGCHCQCHLGVIEDYSLVSLQTMGLHACIAFLCSPTLFPSPAPQGVWAILPKHGCHFKQTTAFRSKEYERRRRMRSDPFCI